MTNISNLPYDVLRLIGDKATESLDEKISKFTSMEQIKDINKLIHHQTQKIKEKINSEIIKGNVYEMEFQHGKGNYQGLYLVNYKVISDRQDNIVVCKVIPDEENERIFGKYKIAERSKRIYCDTLKTYKLVYAPTEVDWKKEERTLIGIKNPFLVYKWNHHALDDYNSMFIPANVIYIEEEAMHANLYVIAELFKANSKHLVLALPDNPNNTAPNRSITLVRVPKNSCYKLTKEYPHVRPCIFG